LESIENLNNKNNKKKIIRRFRARDKTSHLKCFPHLSKPASCPTRPAKKVQKAKKSAGKAQKVPSNPPFF